MMAMAEYMRVARMAAAKAHRKIPCLAPVAEDVTQDSYVAMLECLQRDPHINCAYVYKACYHAIIQAFFRNRYRLVGAADVPEEGRRESLAELVLVRELLAGPSFTPLEQRVIREYFWEGADTVEIGRSLGYAQAYASTVKNMALQKMRDLLGLGPRKKQRGLKLEYSMTRGARSMRRRQRRAA